MASKIIRFSDKARLGLFKGIDELAGAVAVTLGPRGRNVLIERKYGAPTVTKDGVTVAKEIEPGDHFERMGNEMLKAVARKASDRAGDGTTTAVVLAHAIVRRGLALVAAGHDPIGLKRGIDRAVKETISTLQKMAKPARDRARILQVATIASNGDETISKLVADAIEEVGHEGVITVETSHGFESFLEVVEGLDFDRGWISPIFITDPPTQKAVLDRPRILIHPKKLVSADEALPILDAAREAKAKSLLVIAEDVEAEALQVLGINHQRGVLKICAVKAPGFADRRHQILEDVAIATDATLVDAELGLRPHMITADHFGLAKKVVVTRLDTTIIEGAGNAKEIEKRINALRNQIREAKTEIDRDKYELRLASLAAGVAIIRIGGATEVTIKEAQARADNAVRSIRSAMAEGVLPGGGVALLRAANALDASGLSTEEAAGVQIVKEALRGPIGAIAANAGHSPDVVTNAVLAKRQVAWGWDARERAHKDLFAAGIVDPLLVTRVALESAASIAGTFLTTETAIAENPWAYEKDYLDPPVPDRWK